MQEQENMELVVQTKGLTKVYGKQKAVDSVELHIRGGRIYGLLGRNGAGKTTIMKMILGLTAPSAGEAAVFGKKLERHKKTLYPRIGALIEAPGFYPNLTGTENLEIFARLRKRDVSGDVKRALEIMGLPWRDKKRFGEYSLGMKQRLGIANAILHDPELLILDEPTNGLDPIGIAELREFMKKLSAEQGKTILVSSHLLSEISRLADDVGIIDRGVLLEESTMEMLEKKNRRYLLLCVSDAVRAAGILETQFQLRNCSIQGKDTLHIYDAGPEAGEINKALVQRGIEVFRFENRENTLEDYFRKITGGKGIA